MNLNLLCTLIMAISFGNQNHFNSPTQLTPHKYLSVQDTGKYILNIDQNSIAKSRDTVIYNNRKYHLTKFQLKLTNTSSDTLNYLNMSCEWWAIYQFDNKNVGPFYEDCLKNIIEKIEVLPHQTQSISFPILIDSKAEVRGQKFRIGMSVQTVANDKQFFNMMFHPELLRTQKNMIWSNEVFIP